MSESGPQRPAEFCRQAAEVIRGSEERRRRRKRDTGPDVLGMEMKRDLLERAIAADPEPDEFEAWLLQQVIEAPAGGPLRAMAIEIYSDYQNARAVESFGGWLSEGAPTPRFDDQAQGTKKQRG
jgi:hypothetical protein